MPLRYSGSWEAISWAVWEITEPEEELWKAAALSAPEAARISAISHPRRRLQSLAARAARHSLPQAPFYSLSHSYPWAAALSAPYPAALDLEVLRPFPASVIPYFTSPAEQQSLQKGNFTPWHIWCAKELAYKILCAKFDKLSFRRELAFQGARVYFQREAWRYEIRLSFVEEANWLLGIGRLEPPDVLNIEPYDPMASPPGRR